MISKPLISFCKSVAVQAKYTLAAVKSCLYEIRMQHRFAIFTYGVQAKAVAVVGTLWLH